MTEGVGEGEGAAHAVPEQEYRRLRMLARRQSDHRIEVGDRVIDPVDECAGSGRAAVAAMLERVYGVAVVDQPRCDVRVASAVLAGAVADRDDGARTAAGEPRLAVDAKSAGAGKLRLLAASQRPASSAQGTTTASSCGESRATTYSAGSVSETFSSTWVSRGGT